MLYKAYLRAAVQLTAAFLCIQPADAFLNFTSPARVGLRDKISPDTNCPYPKDQWLTGSVLRKGGKNVNSPVAPKGKCTHFEMTDMVPSEIPLSAVKGVSVEGLRWQLGTENLVPGGFTPVGTPTGLEPTGRMVFNPGVDNRAEFKVVVVDVDETTSIVTVELFYRACVEKPFSNRWLACSPFIFPSGITIPLPEGAILPVDITKGQFPKRPDSVRDAI
ncbi:MAG: hypothetical protein ACRC62_19220, partial [Microcoleus sp.]